MMTQYNVLAWYIWSCSKIKYLFPGAHSISYIMQMWNLAYFKIHYSKSFYEKYYKLQKIRELNDAIKKVYKDCAVVEITK